MLPKFLTGSCKRYKEETSSSIDWLVKTAKECGHELDPSTSASTANSYQDSKGSTTASKYKILLKEVRRLTQTISKATVKVPPVILKKVERAISLRKRCAN